MKALMVAGTASGVGKTTLSIGIMAALLRKMGEVRPFKVGPDFIDPAFHEFVTGCAAYNLDSWLLADEWLRRLWRVRNDKRGVAVVEGVMGLYDGSAAQSERGSSAGMAKLLDLPVVLVIDGGGLARSAAAMVQGYRDFDPGLNLAGVIVNRVSGERHYRIIADAVEQEVGVACLGYLPRNLGIELPDRHLGLILPGEIADLEERVQRLGDLISEHVDLDGLVRVAADAGQHAPLSSRNGLLVAEGLSAERFAGLRLGIARDEAFSFYYRANLDLLTEIGVELVEFSPLHDHRLPPDLDGVYIGGGYPEVFADRLAANRSFKRDLRSRLEAGLPAYAECGGFMYLLCGLRTRGGETHPLVGFFPARAVMTDRLQRFGYVWVERADDIRFRAHEFHHSRLEAASDLNFVYRIHRAGREDCWQGGALKKRVLAGFPHLHFGSSTEFVRGFLALCKGEKKRWL